MNISTEVTRAEIIWALKSVSSRRSMRSAEDEPALFKAMFPDSEIASKFILGRDKMSYLIHHGLASYFRESLLQKLRKCPWFVVSFDEAINRISQRGQMDLIIRYFEDETKKVTTPYLNFVFPNRSRAEDLVSKFKEGMVDLPFKILQISMDGPHVNWKFFRIMQAVLWDEKILYDIGSWTLDRVVCMFYMELF